MTSATAAAAAEAVVRTAAAGLTGSERKILRGVNVGASTLSLAGSAFIVLCYILFKELRKFSFKLIFFLALSDMFCSFFSIVGDLSSGVFCYAPGYSAHFFCVASFLWTTTIAFTLHRTVVKHKTDVEDLGSMFHLYVWGTSLAVTVMRSIGNDFGHFGSWCWTETARTGKMAVGMSDRSFHIDSRTDMKGLFNSVAYGLNSSVRRAISERLDLYADGGLRDSEDGCRSMQIKEGNKKKAN
ncbi:G-protein coupled receptor 1 [Acorus gramineus]|uniref:G-protein coupled receptor 1 n=1 Tax=Acorus gramineus TaxID=55184 RepID=A0AAV9BRL0_ACOGR|nr:G-protein coupled receptor 1 [Acorus gramineus]